MALNKVDISLLEDIPAPGAAGKVLSSDGTNWVNADGTSLPAVGADGNVLTSDGTNWASEEAAADLPAPGAAGNVLTSDGTNWASEEAATLANDLVAIRQDIAILALYNAVGDNRAAYNLPNSFIDQFEDITGTTTRTNVGLNDNESFATIYAATETTIPSSSSNFGGNHTSNANYATGSIIFTAGDCSIRSAQYMSDDFAVYATINATPSHGHWIGAFRTDESFSSGHENGNQGGMTDSYIFASASRAGVTAGFSKSTGSLVAYSSSIGDVVKIERIGSTITNYLNGTLKHTATSVDTGAMYLLFGGGGSGLSNYQDVSWEKPVGASAAAGTLISDTQTAPSATTKMSGVILYKDNAGTAALGTDLVISLSANGGTNWTDITASNQYEVLTPVFSTGIKMVKLKEQTVTSGTAPVIKAVWANQAASSKETQLHGWAMNY